MKHFFKNFSQIARTSLRQLALEILAEGIKSVTPQNVIPEVLQLRHNQLYALNQPYDLSARKILVIGAGKASGMMARVVEDILGPENITKGLVIDEKTSIKNKKVTVLRGGHPIPTKESVYATTRMIEMIDGLSAEDLVICLMSGGGSSMLALPVHGISLKDLQIVSKILLLSGAPVHEVNIVRKHLTQITGGQLAQRLQPASVITIIISDTLDTEYDATASGPTFPDKSTYTMALDTLNKYNLLPITPKRIITHLRKGEQGLIPETPKEGSPAFTSVQNIVAAENNYALKAMQSYADNLGFNTHIVSRRLTENVNLVTEAIAGEIRRVPNRTNCCLLAGGEPTITVTGSGMGGRCQALAALMIEQIRFQRDCVFVAAATDGSDFLPGVCGAIVDNETYEAAKAAGLRINDFISQNNTYFLHKKLDNLILADYTDTNVCDLMIFLSKS